MRSSPDRSIDLNADVGEGPGEEPLYALISSANIACGGHAGDEATMREAVALALRHGAAIGAHPSYPDRAGFGRLPMSLPPAELARTIAMQIEALARVAGDLGARIAHVKPHGALYNDAARNPEIATAVASGVSSVSRALSVVGLAGSLALDVWRALGIRAVAEGFADRAYGPGGVLLSRSQPGALVTDPAVAAAQAARLVRERGCETICVHSDTLGAKEILAAVRVALELEGYGVQSPRWPRAC